MTVREERADIEANAFHPSFEAFYRQELQSVIGLAYVLSGSRSGAEDLAQEAFLAAFRHWNDVGMYEDPGGWVRRVVANRTVSIFRRLAAEARALARLGPADYKVPDLTPEAVATWEAVRQLPRRQAQVIALRYFDGQPAADIARILDCSEATVKTHLQRARRALAEKLGEEMPDEDT